MSIQKQPFIDLQNTDALRAIMPAIAIDAPAFVATGVELIRKDLEPTADWRPMCFFFGWKDGVPTITTVALAGEWFRDGTTKNKLVSSLMAKVLQRRSEGEETFLAVMLTMGWFASIEHVERREGESVVQSVERHIEGIERSGGVEAQPNKLEILHLNVIWQDGQRIFLNAVERYTDRAPGLEGWRDGSHGIENMRDRFSEVIGPALASPDYAEAVLAAMGVEPGKAFEPAPTPEQGGAQ